MARPGETILPSWYDSATKKAKKAKKPEKKKKHPLANRKIKLAYFISNCGDGSASVQFFNSEENAEFYAKRSYCSDERFCEDIGTLAICFDKNGKVKEPKPDREEPDEDSESLDTDCL